MKLSNIKIGDSVNIAHLFNGAYQWDFRGHVIRISKSGMITAQDKNGNIVKIIPKSGKITSLMSDCEKLISDMISYYKFFDNYETDVIDQNWLRYKEIESVCNNICKS